MNIQAAKLTRIPTGLGSRHAGRNLGALTRPELGQLRRLAENAGEVDLVRAIDDVLEEPVTEEPVAFGPVEDEPVSEDTAEEDTVDHCPAS